MPYSDMWQDCRITFPHTRPCDTKSSYRSVDPQTLHGNVHQVDHVPNGPTNSAAITTMFPLRLCGDKPLVAVTRERRYGPSRLRVNDDDDFPDRCRYYFAPDAERSIVVLMSVCLSLCAFVCLSVCLSVRKYVSGTTRPAFTNFCACQSCPWVGLGRVHCSKSTKKLKGLC